MKYLVVETYTADGKEFMHFIELSKFSVADDLESFIELYVSRKEIIRKVSFSNTALSNW